MDSNPRKSPERGLGLSLGLFLFFLFSATIVVAQGDAPLPDAVSSPAPSPAVFRAEVTSIDAGAELITIHGRLDGLGTRSEENWVPLVSVLRDTLGDLKPENDRLRYVWSLGYTRPTLWQRVASGIPFMYARVGNKAKLSDKPPSPSMDLSSPDHDLWKGVFWAGLQKAFLDSYGSPLKFSTRSYRQNIQDYRKSQLIRAQTILSLYGTMGNPVFADSEASEIQARLLLDNKTLGGLVDDLSLPRYFEKQLIESRDSRGHNWELLRQRAEAESLYFEPLKMPDGTMTHALLWVAKTDLTANQGKHYEKRFLNIANPWTDKRLQNWQGYTETRYIDSDHQPVPATASGASPVELIPLAVYGLDNPKIPTLLVDFRDGLNPKKREMSRRLLQDLTRNILSLSVFGDLPYFLGHSSINFIMGRRGIDFNQPSRLRSYSQLKLLLALNDSIAPELRNQIGSQLEKVSLNPLENDLEAEARMAQHQYEQLMTYAKASNGLSKKVESDRRAEMVSLEHGKTERFFFRLANILTFGNYTHREQATPDMVARLDVARRLAYHTRFLREVANSGPGVEVKWDPELVKRSLQFIAEHGSEADSRAIRATVKIFNLAADTETRSACLVSLARINNPKAKSELIKISRAATLDQGLKDVIASLLSNTKPVSEPVAAGSISPADGSEQR